MSTARSTPPAKCTGRGTTRYRCRPPSSNASTAARWPSPATRSTRWCTRARRRRRRAGAPLSGFACFPSCDGGGADASVPSYNAYNHHYFSWIVGKHGEVYDAPDERRVPNPTRSAVRDTAPPVPSQEGANSIVFKENPGGEFRKSYHGYPAGYAQLVWSPSQLGRRADADRHAQPRDGQPHRRHRPAPLVPAGAAAQQHDGHDVGPLPPHRVPVLRPNLALHPPRGQDPRGRQLRRRPHRRRRRRLRRRRRRARRAHRREHDEVSGRVARARLRPRPFKGRRDAALHGAVQQGAVDGHVRERQRRRCTAAARWRGW